VLASLDGQPGLRSWRWSERTRSLLILYDSGATSGEAVLDLVAGQLGHEVIEPQAMGPPAAAATPALARAVSQSMAEMDAAVARATGGLVNLRLLFPLGLFAWAALEMSRGSVGPLAWSSALWYAHGLFRDYNLPDPGE
jgi:hypothetical protein